MDFKTRQRLSISQEMQQFGVGSAKDEEMLSQWLDNVQIPEEITFESEDERKAFKADIKQAIDTGISIGTPVKHPVLRFHRFRRQISIAAALVVAISLGAYFLWKNSMGNQEKLIVVAVPQNIEKLPVIMPDSSVAWVSGGSTLSYPEHFRPNIRTVQLSGTGYFSVKPDKQAPFTVHADDKLSVKVLGTSFVVDHQKESGRIAVSVITGVVQVDNDRRSLSVLKPGEKLFYAARDNVYFKKKYDVSEIAKWTDDRTIVLNSVSLGEIAVILEVMYHMHLDFDASLAAKYQFNMVFAKDLPIEEFIHVLSNTSGLHFTKKGDNIKVTL